MPKRSAIVAAGTAAALAVTAGVAAAAPPDGAGPWADGVVPSSTSQGKRKDGTAVLAARSNPQAAVGAAEQSGKDTFFSLGFGGTITLSFTNIGHNGAGADLEIFERTFSRRYSTERADVWVRTAGARRVWVKVADGFPGSGQISLPATVTSFGNVRVIDASDRTLFRNNADGYDLDGVRALHASR